ncbi:MAG TPA: amino acid permease [Phycisphaerae bacterium]|nr:amino acid permease [Phycisphaerae bacterium]
MELKKGLGLVHVFAIASGAMVSSGLFVLPGLAHAMAGPGMAVSYLIAGLLATAGALSVAELTTAMPRAGGDYFFIARGMGAGAGTIAGVLSWFSLSLKSAFAIVGMATFLGLIVSIHGLLAGAILCVVFVGVNLLGVREAARAQVALVAVLLALLAFYVIAGLGQVQGELLLPFAPHGLGRLFTTAGFVFVSYGGLLNIASVAEEVRDPGRNIPRGMVLSLVVVTLIYCLAVFVTGGVLPAEELDHSLTPISDGARAFLGRGGYVALSIGAVLAFITTANAGIMSASRYLLALSRDRLLPAPLAAVNRRFRTPHVAIAITGAVILLSLLLDLRILVEAASTVLIVSGILACLSVIVLRESRLQNYRPAFRAPLYPWLQIVGIAGLGLVLFAMGVEAYVISAVLIGIAFLAYWLYGRKRVSQEFALMHLIERLTARELVTGSLEQELKDIVRERDQIVLDRFDHIVERCPVLDLPGHIGREEFFQLVADRLAERVGATPNTIAARLAEREAQASSLLSPWLAIPHLVVEGQGTFDILLARARKGIAFSDEAPNVQAAFVLAGSRDERNFHLRALAAIAQVVQSPDFHKRWLIARGDQSLRDAVLLGQRQRP